MPNKETIIRLQEIDRCLRDRNTQTDIDILVDKVNRKLRSLGFDDVSERTIRNDLHAIECEPYNAPVQKKMYGHKRLYSYEDADYSIMRQLYPDKMKETLSEAIDLLKQMGDTPQIRWMQTLLEQLCVGADIEDQIECIAFQNNPDLKGLDLLNDLAGYIMRKNVIKLTYKPFHKENEEVYHFSPYLLKQWNNRWFLLGQAEGRDYVSTLPLDRIEKVELDDKDKPFVPFRICEKPTEYFDDVIGVTVNQNVDVQVVKLKIRNQRYPYIETKPIHPSQRRISAESNDEWTTITIQVRPNKELKALLLSYGADVMVVRPQNLREEISKEFTKAMNTYSKD